MIIKRLTMGGIALCTLALSACATLPGTMAGMETAPAPAPARIEVHRETLSNGMVLQVVSRPALPIVTVEMGFLAGANNDPAEKPGIAGLTAAMLTEGAAGKSATDIADAIEFVGGSLQAGADRDLATVGLSVLSRDLPMGMGLLADVVRRPDFAADEFNRVKKEVRSAIQADEDNPGAVAAKAFDAALFGDHPYGRPVNGTLESVDAIGRNDLVAFHSRHYTPDNAVLSFVGDVTPEQAHALAVEVFGDWRAQAAPAPAPPAPKPLTGTRLVTIDKNVAQANVILGHLGLTRDNPDFYPVVLMNYILGGGGFTSRVVKAVRDDQGLAYSVGTGFHARKLSGAFSASFQTRNDSANQAIQSVLAEIRRIRNEPVTEQELSEAKSYLTGSFPLRLDTNRKTAHLLTFIKTYGLGLGYFNDYIERVNQVTVQDIQRVAQTYLHPDQMVWVVVANQEEARIVAP